MARIKTVYPTDMVCHLWANRHPHNIKNAADNVYTQGAAIYSYGSHHVIGAFLDAPVKPAAPIILWNDNTYGATTGKHHNAAWYALSPAQRLQVVRVPDMQDSDHGTTHGLRGLAMACIKAAVSPLEKSDKARSNREYLLKAAANWFNSARALYFYLGDKKAFATVPTITVDATKADALAVLASIKKAEYLQAAAKYIDRANGAFSMCESAEHFYLEKVTRPHNRASARNICTQGVDTVRLCDSAIYEYKKAGVNVPPMVRQLKAKAGAIVNTYTPAAQAENLIERRTNLVKAKRDVMEAISGVKHGPFNRTLKSGTRVRTHTLQGFQWRIERINWPTEHESYMVWPVPAVRTAQVKEWEYLHTRCMRLQAVYTLESSIKSLQSSVDNYQDAVKSGAYTYGVPDSNYVRANLRKMAALFNGAVPIYWTMQAEYVAGRADILAADHIERAARAAAEKIKAWRSGERVTVPRDIPPMVRIVGATLETSYGATVPLDHAARLVRMARIAAARGGVDYPQGTGPKVGHFTVTSIGADMATIIGCHSFTAAECVHAAALIEAACVAIESTIG